MRNLLGTMSTSAQDQNLYPSDHSLACLISLMVQLTQVRSDGSLTVKDWALKFQLIPTLNCSLTKELVEITYVTSVLTKSDSLVTGVKSIEGLCRASSTCNLNPPCVTKKSSCVLIYVTVHSIKNVGFFEEQLVSAATDGLM